jgi:hypothetical protein
VGKKRSSQVEIGSGEDGHYDWISEFSIFEDLQNLLNEMESVDRTIQDQRLSVFLSDLRKQYLNIPRLEYLDSAFDLIKDHPAVSVESEFFDPDMPFSSIWTKVYVKRSDIPNLVEILEAAKERLEEIYEHEGVPELLRHQEEEIERQRKEQEDAENRRQMEQEQEEKKRQKREEDEWVEETFLRVCKSLKKKSGIELIDEFLIDTVGAEIFVLTVHKDYSKNRLDREVRVTQKLMERYRVYEIAESSPPGSGYIPYFAGARRKNVMGWRQNKSVLFSSDLEGLMKANIIRDRYVSSLGG